MQITTATLAAQPFLKGMSPEHLKVLAGDAMQSQFKAGEMIFDEGEPANRFYLILSGKVALQSPTDSEHEPVPIQTIEAGDVLGWSWLFPPYCWHFDARAITPVKAIFFYGTRLSDQCEADHELGYELLKRVSAVVVERLQSSRLRLAEQAKTLPAADLMHLK